MRLDGFERALVIAPHTDDGELGAGGLIYRLVGGGTSVTYLALSDASHQFEPGQNPLRRECAEALAVLGVFDVRFAEFETRRFSDDRQGVLDALIGVRDEVQPQLVLAPSSADTHQDHEVVNREAIRAFKRTTLLGYSLPWNVRRRSAQVCVELDGDAVKSKIDALCRYESQSHRPYMQPDVVRAQAVEAGLACGCEYAELFEAIRIRF